MNAANLINRLNTAFVSPSAGLLALRIWVGVVGVYHGAQKLFGAFGGPGLDGFAGFLESLSVPMPYANAVAAASAEFFGGLLVAVGVLPRLAAVPFMITMLVAAFMVHGKAFSAQNGGLEYPMTLAVMLLAIIVAGPGRFTLDRVLFGRGAKAGALRPAAA